MEREGAAYGCFDTQPPKLVDSIAADASAMRGPSAAGVLDLEAMAEALRCKLAGGIPG
jgi:hypothetical protein